MPGGGLLTAWGRGEVLAAVVVEYFPRRVVRKGTRKKNGEKQKTNKLISTGIDQEPITVFSLPTR